MSNTTDPTTATPRTTAIEPPSSPAAASDNAARALVEFNRVQPYLTAMAQAITRRRDVKVKLSEAADASSFTDGATIYISPFQSFYKTERHSVRLCDRRDSHWQQLCPECKRREELMSFLFHEIAHLVWRSFRPIDPITVQAHPWTRAPWLDDATRAKITTKAESFKYPDYVALAMDTGQYMQFMCNALEDMRIEAAMAKVRANTWDMVTARHMKFLEDGEGFYEKFPLNLQIIVGLIFLNEGSVSVERLFSPQIAADLRDPFVQDFVSQVESWGGIEEVYENAIDLYGYLVGKGYFDRSAQNNDPQFENKNSKPKPDKKNKPSSEEKNDGESVPDSKSEPDEVDPWADPKPSLPGGDEPEESGEGTPGEEDEETEDDSTSDEDDKSGDQAGEEPDRATAAVKAGITGTGDEFEDAKGEKGAGSAESGDDDDTEGDDSATGTQAGASAADSNMGTPEEVAKALDAILGHASKEEGGSDHQKEVTPDAELADKLTREEIRRLAMKPVEFSREDSAVKSVVRLTYNGTRWVNKADPKARLSLRSRRTMYDTSIVPDETIYARALMQLKLVFEKNARGTKSRNLKSGKVNANVLGKRASIGDDRLFYNKSIPKKRDYVVLLHLDCSASTDSGIYSQTARPIQTLAFEKKAIYAQAELLNRLRIPFIIIAGSGESSTTGGYRSMVFEIKTASQPWDDRAKRDLEAVPPTGFNLDGHAMLIAEWELMKEKSTDKILMYYSDGEMPYANYDDELVQMKKAFATAAQNKIVIMGVGVTTDSPNAHGLPTVRIDTPDDLYSVVAHLGKQLGLM